VDEVVAFAEQGLSKTDGGCIREAITIVESSAMTSLAEAAESGTGQLPLFRIDRDQFSILAREKNQSKSRNTSRPYLDSITIEPSTKLATDIRIVSAASIASR
jgi:hypothetical protein